MQKYDLTAAPFFRKKIDTCTLDDKFEFLTHERGGVDTILTSGEGFEFLWNIYANLLIYGTFIS